MREVVQRLNASRGRCEDAYDMASGAPDTHEQEELSREADPAGHDWLEFVAPDVSRSPAMLWLLSDVGGMDLLSEAERK